MAIHNATGCVVPLKWLFLDSHSTVDLIANPNILVNIRNMQGENAIRVHCNSGVKIVDQVGDLPGYKTVWYKPINIANILSMSRSAKKFRVVFDSKRRNGFKMVFPDREVRFQISPNGLYYFYATYRENSLLIIKTVSENREGLTQRD